MGAVDEDRVPYMSTGHLVMAVFEGDAWPDDMSKDLVALRTVQPTLIRYTMAYTDD